MAVRNLVFNSDKNENNILEGYYIAKVSLYSSWKKEFLSVIVGKFHCQKNDNSLSSAMILVFVYIMHWCNIYFWKLLFIVQLLSEFFRWVQEVIAEKLDATLFHNQ